MIKKYLSAFGRLLAVVVFLVMTLTALAQVQPQGSPEERGAVPPGTPPGASTAPGGGMADSKMMRGTVSGEVVNVDARAGVIEIRTDQGQPQTFKVDESAKGELRNIRKGDHVNLNLVLRAVDIRPTGKGGAQPGAPDQREVPQDKHRP